ncbi:peptidoglycan-binding protein [Pelagibius sp. Alg239-R121]|uniref:peptidoglycan-binding domain-containing protein n=1 Tax=Pelagibius sp. Alg239-R121 TaxID=2993448 RepID=UPI0024A72881|nr:peptidoglycan-binding domain-containing protein [Pelagibius sp. Alg239-R121]
MKLLRLALCGLLFQTTAALAADSNNKFAMKGAGFLPCQIYVKAREDKNNVYYMIGGWLEGYISAHNRLSEDTFDVMSFESLELLLSVIEVHCRSNPEDVLYGVVDSMLTEFGPDRLEASSPKVQIVEGERKTALYRETIRRMQVKLTELGLFKDEADGRFNDATRSALIAFQSDLNFETTGFPDQTTLWRLLRK